jgi:SulP family sulfate permease
MKTTQLAKYLPILNWGRSYDRDTLTNDLIAAVIVTIMLIPQSLAYALLAGLPPEMGLYASMLPIILYAVFGTSRALAVGPVAVVSLLTVTAVSRIAVPGSSEYIAAAITLAFLSGLILLALGLFRLGFLANFLSHPVIAGFITATGIIIAASQLKHILGIRAQGHTLPDLIGSLAHNASQVNWITAVIGVAATGFLFWVRKGFLPLLIGLGSGPIN